MSKKVKERERKLKKKEEDKIAKLQANSAFGTDKEARKKGTGEDTTGPRAKSGELKDKDKE